MGSSVSRAMYTSSGMWRPPPAVGPNSGSLLAASSTQSPQVRLCSPEWSVGRCAVQRNLARCVCNQRRRRASADAAAQYPCPGLQHWMEYITLPASANPCSKAYLFHASSSITAVTFTQKVCNWILGWLQSVCRAVAGPAGSVTCSDIAHRPCET